MIEQHIGVIGGSGLYALEGLQDVSEQRVQTPFGEPSDAIVSGTLGTTRLHFLPRHGRAHAIAPHRINFRANVHALKQVGARQVVSVSAVGSLREDVAPGDFVFVDQFIDRTRSRPGTFFEDDGVVAHVGLAEPTDPALSHCLAAAAERCGVRTHRGGTYVCIEGPQFSTRAESELYRAWGASVVGMTNLPEARLAREAELPYATVAMVTDYDCWHDTEEPVSVEAVLAVLARNVTHARSLLSEVRDWPDPAESPASHALRGALLTPPHAIHAAARARLSLLLGRYL